MRALTFHRPWDRLIAKGIKLVENRAWKPTLQQLRPGEVFAIHAGKQWDPNALVMARRLGISEGVIETLGLEGEEGGQIVGVVEYRGCTVADPSPWFFGPIGWGLADAFEFPTPIPCRGFQGMWSMWTPHSDVQAQIDRALAGVYP
jgi:hypothetical protein